jgi:hypothetical protein
MRKYAVLCGAFAAAVCVMAMPARAADVKSEIMTAEQHATLAAQAQSIDMVHMHLHHVLNCLVGPKGTDYDAQELDPCKNTGSGAIPDTTEAATKQKLKTAVAKAKGGLQESNLAAAQKDAADAATTLDTAK